MTSPVAATDPIVVAGTVLRVAPMTPADAPALDRFHETLSAATTHRRFFNVHPHLSRRELDRFTHVDHVDREALVAFDGDDIVAVARLDRTAPRGDTAETAFVVADPWQHRGVMTALFDRLVVRARDLGIDWLVADTLASNAPMLALLGHAGLPHSARFADGIVQVTVGLSPRPRAAHAGSGPPA